MQYQIVADARPRQQTVGHHAAGVLGEHIARLAQRAGHGQARARFARGVEPSGACTEIR